MHISRLQIFGFKSFLQRLDLEFDGQICALVGPNGCGKTNIVDAIRWVLGEQRPTLLRGEKMEEVIFHGTKARKPLGMAEVTLTIDNSANLLPTEFSEVTLTRRLFRSGESEYLLNRVPCRLKDIHHLLYDTGMGVGAYSILSREQIDALLSSKEEERRTLLEEAAGITRYKSQRREAQRKLELTKKDLVRIADIISEVEKRTANLGRQARLAQRYEERREEINRLSLLLARRDYGRLKVRLEQIGEEMKALKEGISQEEDRIKDGSIRLDEIAEKLKERRKELSRRREKLNELFRRVGLLKGESSLQEERIRNLRELTRRERREEERLRDRLTQTQEERRDIKGELEDLAPQISKVEEEVKGQEGYLSQLEEEHLTLKKGGDALRGELAGLTEGYQVKGTEKERFSAELEGITKQEERLREEEREIREKLGVIEKRRRESRSKFKTLTEELKRVERNLISEREEHRTTEERLKKLTAERERLKELISSLDSQIRLLKQLVSEKEGFPPGAKALLEKEIPQVKGALADLINAKEGYEEAIEAALGPAVQYLIVEDLSLAQKCLLLLKREESGRASLIPLDGILIPEPSPSLPPASIGWAKDLVRCDPKYRPILHFLLDRWVVVERIPSHPQEGLNWVSLDGETRLFWGMVSGGSQEVVPPLIGRERKLAQLLSSRRGYAQEERALVMKDKATQEEIGKIREKIAILKEERENIGGRLREAERQLDRDDFLFTELTQRVKEVKSKLKESLERRKKLEKQLAPIFTDLRDLEAKRGKMEEELRKKEAQWEKVEAERRELTRRLNEGRMRLISLEGRREELKGRLVRIDEIQDALKDNIRERKGERERLQWEREKLEEERGETKGQLAQLASKEEEEKGSIEKVIDQERRLNQEWEQGKSQLKAHQEKAAEMGARLHQLEVEYAQVETQAEGLSVKTRENFGVEIEGIQEPDKVEVTPERIEALKERLRRQGPVNLLALDEYQKEKERLDFLRSQKEDLEEAEASLERTIAKIDYTAREKFLQTLKKININFQEVFRELFSGGEAQLRLKPGTDPLEAEVDISVSPEGKRLFSLGQLSGGEKTLTAIALLFSLYLVKPSPFCILDEVDAPLDDENVERFLRLVRRFSQNSQFIIITHNKRTMAETNLLYGITMEEPGVSKLVSVKVKGD